MYKIKKEFTCYPSEFYVNVAIFHLPTAKSILCEELSELPIIKEDLP